jgi:hypothetical protein
MKRHSISIYLLISLFILLLIITSLASASLVGYKLPWWSADNGGGASSDNHYKLQGAIGQPDAGLLSNSSYTLRGGFWGFGSSPHPSLYLPLTLKSYKNYYTPPCELANNYCEPNNSLPTAFGPLDSAISIQAYPNDEDDYYYFYLNAPAVLTISVTHYQEINPQADGQLQLRDAQATILAGDTSSEDHALTVGPIEIQTPGKYYVYLYSGTLDQNNLYTLTVIK